jgi:hypothetical protein
MQKESKKNMEKLSREELLKDLRRAAIELQIKIQNQLVARKIFDRGECINEHSKLRRSVSTGL